MHWTQTSLIVGAATTFVAAAAMPAAFDGTLERNGFFARDSSNCTEYCSVSAGCVCTVRPSDCTALYEVQSGESCVGIAESFANFTVSQLYRWNPDIGQTCQGLRAYVPICINTPWYTFTPPVQADYGTVDTPEDTPVPLMPFIVDGCQKFELVAPGTRVETLAEENNFAVEDFAKWNGNATTAWADYWVCVSGPSDNTDV